MATLALHVLNAADAGKRIPHKTLAEIRPEHWEAHFDELRSLCPDRMTHRDPEPATNRNRLRIEGDPRTLQSSRCKGRSPDGRGLVWLLSGGDPAAYGECRLSDCYRARRAKGK